MFGLGSSKPAFGGLRLADDAMQLLVEARNEADRLRHEYVATEHLVLALTRQPDGIAAATFAHLGIDCDLVHRSIAEALVSGHGQLKPGAERPYTSRTMKAFTLAADSARELGHTRIGAAHVLVGLMREGRSIGAQMLQHHGLTAESAFEEIRRQAADGGAT
jgi:ATP-dependent Clp protease ATP-binding subunit ClpC